MSSMDTPEKEEKYHRFKANFSIKTDDRVLYHENFKNAMAKFDQFFYFRKDKIDYTKVGEISEEFFELIKEFIIELSQKNIEFIQIIDNLLDANGDDEPEQ